MIGMGTTLAVEPTASVTATRSSAQAATATALGRASGRAYSVPDSAPVRAVAAVPAEATSAW